LKSEKSSALNSDRTRKGSGIVVNEKSSETYLIGKLELFSDETFAIQQFELNMEGYEKLEQFGHGSFGRVWKARSKCDGAVVATKEIDFSAMRRREKELLANEANILRTLNNPDIVKYIDRHIKRDKKRIFIAMEYCSGGDLQHFITSTRGHCEQIAEDQIWLTLTELAVALRDCHSGPERILHRDIKPANVFIDADGHVKLGDFGLAKPLTSDFANTMVGTPFYMSPELISGKRYDEKSDIWALGCVIYEMAVLRPPFNSILRSEDELKRNILHQVPKRLPPLYSEALTSCVRSMLQKNPAKRPRADDILKLRNVNITLKLETVRKELTAVREKRAALKEQTAALLTRAERLARMEARLKPRENRENVL
jgi:NIMA (never in mitosis gene a)-related kinase